MNIRKNKIISITVVLILALVMLLPGTTTAQDVIPEYTAEINLPWNNYADRNPIISFEYAELQTETGSARAASRIQMADIVVEKYVDEDSARLFVECAKGSHWDEITIWVYSGDSSLDLKVMEIRLEDAWFTSYSVRGEHGSELPQEVFSIRYGKIRYYKFKTDQSSTYAGWDLGKNEQLS